MWLHSHFYCNSKVYDRFTLSVAVFLLTERNRQVIILLTDGRPQDGQPDNRSYSKTATVGWTVAVSSWVIQVI